MAPISPRRLIRQGGVRVRGVRRVGGVRVRGGVRVGASSKKGDSSSSSSKGGGDSGGDYDSEEMAMLARDMDVSASSGSGGIDYGAPPPPLPSGFERIGIGSAPGDDGDDDGEKTLKERVNDLLVYDFFFILACLAFFTAGLVQRAADADDKSVILDAFVFAWPWLIQPAITLLMTGAIVQGASGWIASKLDGDK